MITAIYLRVSTDEQNCDSQRNELETYRLARKWSDIRVYQDVMSGGKASRPGLDALLRDIRAGKVERLLAFKLDRLGRSLAHLAALLTELEKHNVPLIIPGQGIDTSNDTPAGRLQLNVLGAVAEFERGIIRERVAAGLKAAKSRGVRLGRAPVSAYIFNRALELRAEGCSLRSIARTLGISAGTVQNITKGKHVRHQTSRGPIGQPGRSAEHAGPTGGQGTQREAGRAPTQTASNG